MSQKWKQNEKVGIEVRYFKKRLTVQNFQVTSSIKLLVGMNIDQINFGYHFPIDAIFPKYIYNLITISPAASVRKIDRNKQRARQTDRHMIDNGNGRPLFHILRVMKRRENIKASLHPGSKLWYFFILLRKKPIRRATPMFLLCTVMMTHRRWRRPSVVR